MGEPSHLPVVQKFSELFAVAKETNNNFQLEAVETQKEENSCRN